MEMDVSLMCMSHFLPQTCITGHTLKGYGLTWLIYTFNAQYLFYPQPIWADMQALPTTVLTEEKFAMLAEARQEADKDH